MQNSKLLSNQNAQGTIEYLVILAVVVVISLVVVGLFTGIFSSTSQQISTSSDKFSAVSGGISVVESVIDQNGDSLVFLSNNSNDSITLKKISAGVVENTFDNTLVSFDSKGFNLGKLDNACPCESGQKSVKCEFKLEFETASGLTKTEYKTISVQCVTDSVPTNEATVVDNLKSVVKNNLVTNAYNEIVSCDIDTDYLIVKCGDKPSINPCDNCVSPERHLGIGAGCWYCVRTCGVLEGTSNMVLDTNSNECVCPEGTVFDGYSTCV